MCGIFGILTSRDDLISPDELRRETDSLFKLSESRGKEAAGIIVQTDAKILTYKEPVGASKFIQSEQYGRIFTLFGDRERQGVSPLSIIGHARLATNGLQTENRNNQPVVTHDTLGVHNGIVVNDKAIWKKIGKKPKYEVDTEAIFELLNIYLEAGLFHEEAIQMTYGDLEGSASLAMLFQRSECVALSTNTGSLYILSSADVEMLVFASESYILKQWQEEFYPDSGHWTVSQVHAGKGVLIHLSPFTFSEFPLNKKPTRTKVRPVKRRQMYSLTDYSDLSMVAEPTVVMLYRKLNDIRKLKRHDFDYKAIYVLRRCIKCILPETTPFIGFDQDGICSYCHEHKKIVYKGKKSLEKFVEPYRSRHGEPDCIIAFSGGRDSSYGLHFLKKELGLNPIAYTYDWGMVTDIARRNEARMVGGLGVEHVIVSADITMKRDHIRKHILAWMKKPDLGMVPLFMEGDKQCEFYADRLAKQNAIKLIFFCRGNELEKDEFKTGHSGVKNADPGGVIHNLSLSGKLNMAVYYAWQYITNPAYINSSLFDTAFAYFSTYVQKHDYVFLWHYIPWDEKTILSTIQKNYNWEVSPETFQRWRTDDGTSAFYNYIYYAGQGFTENDSFRARQIREGKLTRQEALHIVHKENKPRYEALKWYFDRVGLDGDEVLTVVDAMPRLY